ncbi:MAG TPA: AraC family transcriptional regulator [Pirellulaceae bacterium]|nr:AraC family transcriptional regulator [Pirellulaceae bacterium]HMO93139.1 AraC family transcriptional regulator [Pirellulaceae bacterium]HMP71299.1 AraC family transcriptional regulator [Pirellulaceae bacterium]
MIEPFQHKNMKSRTKTPKSVPITTPQTVDLRTLQSLFDQAPDIAFFVKDANGCYLAVNDSLIARHGLKSKHDALGKRPSDICEGDLGSMPAEQDQRVLTTGKPLFDLLELQWYRPGHAVWCLTTKLPLRDSEGRMIGLVGFSRDLRAPVATEEIPTGFARMIAEFENDPSQLMSPAILAQRSELTPSRLARMTKKLFLLTPSQLITKIRITSASHLLRSSTFSIVEIALQCGYADQSAFTRAFRALTSSTPLEFRNREIA